MLVYWEQSVVGVQVENFDTKEEDEHYEIQKPQMQNTNDEQQMEDLLVNKILIFDLQMSNTSMNNYCKNEGLEIQKFEDDLSRVSIELATIFV